MTLAEVFLGVDACSFSESLLVAEDIDTFSKSVEVIDYNQATNDIVQILFENFILLIQKLNSLLYCQRVFEEKFWKIDDCRLSLWLLQSERCHLQEWRQNYKMSESLLLFAEKSKVNR